MYPVVCIPPAVHCPLRVLYATPTKYAYRLVYRLRSYRVSDCQGDLILGLMCENRMLIHSRNPAVGKEMNRLRVKQDSWMRGQSVSSIHPHLSHSIVLHALIVKMSATSNVLIRYTQKCPRNRHVPDISRDSIHLTVQQVSLYHQTPILCRDLSHTNSANTGHGVHI